MWKEYVSVGGMEKNQITATKVCSTSNRTMPYKIVRIGFLCHIDKRILALFVSFDMHKGVDFSTSGVCTTATASNLLRIEVNV